MLEVYVKGVLRDLRHLQEFVVVVAGKGKEGADLRVAVSLGRHAVSRGCVNGAHDLLDENGKPRLFCEDRYAFSLGLPELARRMLEQNYFCWESIDRNRATNFAIIDVAPGRIMQVPAGEHQVVFFYLFPCATGNADVNLVVTSCHKRSISLPKRRYGIHSMLRRCLYEQKRVP